MDTINELNSRPCKACIQKTEESESITPVDLMQDHFQDYLKLLEFESMREREIAIVCLSGVQAITAARILAREGSGKVEVLKGGVPVWQEIEA